MLPREPGLGGGRAGRRRRLGVLPRRKHRVGQDTARATAALEEEEALVSMGFLPQVWAAEALEVLRSNVAIAAGGRESEAWRYQCKAFRDDRYRRKVERVIEHPVTDEERTAFAAAEAAWALLEASPYFEIDGFDANPILTPPQPRREYVYAETETEWIERCRRIDAGTS